MKHSKEHQLILDRVMEYVVLVGIPTKPEQRKIESYLDVALDGSTRYKDSKVAFENLCDLVQEKRDATLSKGDRQRKSQVPDHKVRDNWDKIFKKKPKREEKK